MPPRRPGPYDASLLNAMGNRLQSVRQVLRVLHAPGAAEAAQLGRDQFYAANKQAFNEVRTVLKLRLSDGSDFDWELADGIRLVEKCVHSSEMLQALFERSLAKQPCSRDRPWQVIRFLLPRGLSGAPACLTQLFKNCLMGPASPHANSPSAFNSHPL
jgi:hypothetical protein